MILLVPLITKHPLGQALVNLIVEEGLPTFTCFDDASGVLNY